MFVKKLVGGDLGKDEKKTDSLPQNGSTAGSKVFKPDPGKLGFVLLWVMLCGILQWLGSLGNNGGVALWNNWGAGVPLLCVTVGLILMYRLCVGPLMSKNKPFIVTWGSVLFQLGCFVVLRHMLADATGNVSLVLICLPYILAPLMVSALLGALQGVFATVATCLLGGFFIFPNQLNATDLVYFLSLSSLSGMLTVFLACNVRSRVQVLRTGFLCGLLVLALCCILGVIDLKGLETNLMGVIKHMCAAFGVSLLVCVIVSGVMPMIENIFKIILPLSWLEMADMNRPLMKRLQMEAPGTFHHCLMVAQLAEAAAEEIEDANPAECRVMAYYHDIGKLEDPLYFTENVQDVPSPHEGLTAASSARKIIKHVQDGVTLAKKAKLPQPLVDVIEQHHGTSLAYYFYRKAQQDREAFQQKVQLGMAAADDVPEVVESNFRYAGPIPQSKEVAIVSLADIVESATRSMSKMTVESIRDKVKELIRDRVVEGHLDDSGLTLSDLKKIADSFANTLKNIHHNRIAYPSRETEKKTVEDAQLKLPLGDDKGEVQNAPAEAEENTPQTKEK